MEKAGKPSFLKKTLFIVAGVCLLFVGISVAIGLKHKDRFEAFSLQAKQAEAKVSLNHLATMLSMHHAVHETYRGVTIAELELAERPDARYQLKIIKAGKKKFKATATAPAGVLASCAGKDVWSIDQDRNLSHEQDGQVSCK